MKNKSLQKLLSLMILFTTITTLLTGCGQSNTTNDEPLSSTTANVDISSPKNEDQDLFPSDKPTKASTELYVQFGDDGATFTMNLYDNATADAIARHVGAADWRIPIYNYEGYDNWEVMQYYDIPSRYEIPSIPESVDTHKAGTIYYSDPNRIVLFYKDAEVSGEYTLVGYFDATKEFVSAVENNPVLDGWSNKIIKINAQK